MTTTSSLADSLPVVIDSARIHGEYMGVMSRTCETHKLPSGSGLNWDEVTLARLSAQAITETTELDNPQLFSDTLLSITPGQVGIQTRVTDKVKSRITPIVAAKMGQLAANAMGRKKEQDYIAMLDGATTSLSGAGTTLVAGVIGAAKSRISSNTTEIANSPIYGVLHGFQIKDLQDELTSGIGTYAIPAGMTEQTYREGFAGSVYGVQLYECGNISIDSSDDAKGGVHAKMAVLYVQGSSMRSATVRKEHIGGGAEDMFIYDDYAFGERLAGGTSASWLYEVYSDATAPTT